MNIIEFWFTTAGLILIGIIAFAVLLHSGHTTIAGLLALVIGGTILVGFALIVMIASMRFGRIAGWRMDRALRRLRSRFDREEVVPPTDIEQICERAQIAWDQKAIEKRREDLLHNYHAGGLLREVYLRLLMLDRKPTDGVRSAVLDFARGDGSVSARSAAVEWIGNHWGGEEKCALLLDFLDDREDEVAGTAVVALADALPAKPSVTLIDELRTRRQKIERHLDKVREFQRKLFANVLRV